MMPALPRTSDKASLGGKRKDRAAAAAFLTLTFLFPRSSFLSTARSIPCLTRDERSARSEERGKRKEEWQSGSAAFSILTFLFPRSSFLSTEGRFPA
jgi:hypothetical protein